MDKDSCALLCRGANVSAKNKEGITPAERARLCGNERLADWLGNQSRLRRLLSPPNSQGGSNNSRSFNRSKSTLDDVPREEACVVCWERRREVILAPCGHKVMCKRDTRRVMEGPEEKRFCPMCKEKIDSFVTTVYEHV